MAAVAAVVKADDGKHAPVDDAGKPYQYVLKSSKIAMEGSAKAGTESFDNIYTNITNQISRMIAKCGLLANLTKPVTAAQLDECLVVFKSATATALQAQLQFPRIKQAMACCEKPNVDGVKDKMHLALAHQKLEPQFKEHATMLALLTESIANHSYHYRAAKKSTSYFEYWTWKVRPSSWGIDSYEALRNIELVTDNQFSGGSGSNGAAAPASPVANGGANSEKSKDLNDAKT